MIELDEFAFWPSEEGLPPSGELEINGEHFSYTITPAILVPDEAKADLGLLIGEAKDG